MFVFISYRWEDEPELAHRLAAFLKSELGRDSVFLDREHLWDGREFPPTLKEAIECSWWFLPIIGKGWIVDRRGIDHSKDDRDFVRGEVQHAFEKRERDLLAGKPELKILPVMVGNVDWKELRRQAPNPYDELLDALKEFPGERVSTEDPTEGNSRVLRQIRDAQKKKITKCAMESFVFSTDQHSYKVSGKGHYGSRSLYLTQLVNDLALPGLKSPRCSGPVRTALKQIILATNAIHRLRESAFFDNSSESLLFKLPNHLSTLMLSLEHEQMEAESKGIWKS